MRCVAACCLALVVQPLAARDAYQVRQENRNYEAWREKAFFGSSPSSPSSSYSHYQPPAQPKSDYSRQASDQFLRQRMKEENEYNARVARENARIDALNRRYDRRALLNQQALAGNVGAMRLLAQDVLSDSAASEKDKQAAKSWMAEAAFHHDPEAMQYVEMVAEARKRAQEEAVVRQRAQLWEGARAGDVHAMYNLGTELFDKTTPDLHRNGIEFLQRCIEKGDEPAMSFVVKNVKNDGALPDDLALYALARDALGMLPGHAEDAFIAGSMHIGGGALCKPDREKALPFMEKAAAEGYADAFYRMGEAYEEGKGGPRDPAQAAQWFRKALGHEHPEFGIADERTANGLTRALLDPTCEPASHAEELLSLWDKHILDNSYLSGKDTAIRAADALASGILHVQDFEREVLYLSRAVNGSWSDDDAADQLRLSKRLGDYLVNRFQPGLRIAVKDGNHFKVREARRVDGLVPLWDGVARYEARLEPCLAVAYTALGMSEEELESIEHPSAAVELFDSIAGLFDDSRAWYESGRLRLLGKGVPQDFVGANERLLKAWEKGNAHAALYLAILQQKKWVAGATDEAANGWIKKGAERGDPECMTHYGSMLFRGPDGKPNASEEQRMLGLDWLRKAVDAGDLSAMDTLADIFETGNGAPQNEVQALALVTRASNAGLGSAKRKLAVRMAEGRGVPKDQSAAIKLMFEAAQTDMLAAGNLGVVLWRGDWGEKDVPNGLQWMEVALERGFWPAGRNLAKIHHLGLGIAADETKARAYLERAGQIGGEEAAQAVAELYAKGEVITKDEEAAARWRTKAGSPQS